MSCDYSKAISGTANPLTITVQPGQTHVETWDWSGCVDGAGRQLRITSVNFALSTKAKDRFLTITAALDGVNQPILNRHVVMADVTGKLFRLFFVVSKQAKQPASVGVSYSCNVGG